MQTNLQPPENTFDFISNKPGTPIIVVGVRKLTINQRVQIRNHIIDQIKTDRRNEAIEFSKKLVDAERIRFLVESAKANLDVTESEIASRMRGDFVVKEVLTVATNGEINTVDFDLNAEMIASAYLFALGIAPNQPNQPTGEHEHGGTF